MQCIFETAEGVLIRTGTVKPRVETVFEMSVTEREHRS